MVNVERRRIDITCEKEVSNAFWHSLEPIHTLSHHPPHHHLISPLPTTISYSITIHLYSLSTTSTYHFHILLLSLILHPPRTYLWLWHFHNSQKHRLSLFALLSIPFNSTTHNYLPHTISIPSLLSSLLYLLISLLLLTLSLQIYNTLSKRFSPQMTTSNFRWNSRWNSHKYHPFSGKLFGETGEMGKPNKKLRKWTSRSHPFSTQSTLQITL